MNQTQLIGRLTSDPELRHTTTGVPIASFTLAVNRSFKNQAGEREADFIRCVAFQKTAELLSQYTNKGSRIGVVGRIQTGSYDKPDGTKVYTTDVVVNELEFLDTKQESQGQRTSRQQSDVFDQMSELDVPINEDDLPFSYRL